jgi:cytochrome c oxidase accessory protein FixG
MSRVHLPVVEDRPSSLRSDGTRVGIVPADVKGRFTRLRFVVRWILIAFAAALPFVKIEDRPALFLDVPARRFFIFGASLNAQDAWLLFFGLTALGFGLVVATALLGRAWCGWACPQTVLLEGLFRPVERWIEGPRNTHLKRDAGAWTFARVWRKALKHALFVLIAMIVAHMIAAYFASLPSLGTMILEGPFAHPEAFLWCTAIGAIVYADMAWFREQLCLVVCPYGRLQSVLTDDDSLFVGYDEGRGEPRGHRKKDANVARGDCVDCGRCVVVCPTGIDIRHGMQVDCIACTQCIDACDEVMDKLEKPRGLIRYDSLRGLRGEARRLLRPRLALYAVLAVVGAVVLTFALAGRTPFEATLTRAPGALFVRDGEAVRNSFELHVVNKRDVPGTFAVEVVDRPDGAEVMVAPHIELAPLASRRLPVVVRTSERLRVGASVTLRITEPGDEPIEVTAPVIGPLRAR